MSRDLTQLDALERYLEWFGFHYERRDEELKFCDYHQIIVYDKEGTRLWDAVCHTGSYGNAQGLLEIMGSLVTEEGYDVIGWLTAEDVIRRVEAENRRVKDAPPF